MKVIIRRSTFIDGKPLEASKKPVNIANNTAKVLIAMGKAVPVVDEKEDPGKKESKDPKE